MARNFRIYEKKRGNRRTGSKTVGNLGEALFFAVFLLLGCAGLTVIFTALVIPEWRANHVFVEGTCAILDRDVGKHEGPEGTAYRPRFKIRYHVEGADYVEWTYDIRGATTSDKAEAERILDRFSAGQEVPFWYDPSDPSVAVLVRGYSWWFWLLFSVPVSFILIGGGGLIYAIWTWGKSAERRAALAQKAKPLELLDPGRRSEKPKYPHVPTEARLADSPGTTLRFRLPPVRSPAWSLAIWLVACLLWNAVLAPFVVVALRCFLRGEPDWFMTIFLVPFLAIGIGLFVMFLRQVLVTTGVGPTLVEVSELPLYPGRHYEMFLSQTGRLKMNSLEVLLVCEEEATFRHGTNTRTESQCVYQQPLFRQEGFEVRRGLPFEARCPLEVPAGAMHSFKSDHNQVRWKILVKGDVLGWPNYERSFPLIVYPEGNGQSTA